MPFLLAAVSVTAMNASNSIIEITFNSSKDSLSRLILNASRLSKDKDYDQAIGVFNKALKIASENELNRDASFIYKKIGGIYYSQKDYENSRDNFNRSILIDSLSKNAADSHFNLSLIYRKEKRSDSLIYHLFRSLNLYEILPESYDTYNTFLKGGMILRGTGNYDSSIKYLLLSYDGFDKLNDQSKKASVCNSIAATQRLLGNYELAKRYYQENLKLRETIGDSTRLSFGYNNLANLYKEQNVFDSARYYYERAIGIQRTMGTSNRLGRYYYNLGIVNYLEGHLMKARGSYLKSVAIKKLENDTLALANSYKELALVYIDQRELGMAKRYIDSAAVFFEATGDSDALLRYYEVQSIYHKSIGDFEKAQGFSERYSSLYESLFKAKQARAIQELQERFESKQKLGKIKKLTFGNEKQKAVIAEQESSIRSRDLLLGLALLLLLLLIVIYYLLRQKQKTKEKDLELHRLESIFQGQEVIKDKISKDLHDIVTTSFDAIRLKILAMPNSKNPENVGRTIVSDVKEINEQIRLISHRLSPLGHKVKDALLTDIIIDQLTEFQYYRKIFVSIKLPLPEQINRFSLSAQTNLYGIILEALNNIEKHSQATEVEIDHIVDDDEITMSISDNGIGFNSDKKRGIGLLNIEQRSELLKGSCVIDSSEKRTTVKVRFPIKPNME